jgi:diguanylate cyclase
MSIASKLSLLFSLLFTVFLSLDNTLIYWKMKQQLLTDQENLISTVAMDITTDIDNSTNGTTYLEKMVGEKLRVAAIAAEYQLDPDIDHVTNEQLVKIANEVGVSHITLLKKVGDDIIALKSSNPKEINLSTKGFGQWFQAFQQLFSLQPVTVPIGQKLPNFWSGPIEISTSEARMTKWGYYYDGTTNYIIDPFMNEDYIRQFRDLTGPESIINKIMKNTHSIIEITAFNPQYFCQKVETPESTKYRNRPIIFGSYNYVDKNDQLSVLQANESGKLVRLETRDNGKHLIKEFIPVQGKSPYVLGFVIDYDNIQLVLNEHMYHNGVISLLLLIVLLSINYWFSSYIVRPVRLIIQKVKEIAEGNFDAQVVYSRKDELGILGTQVNIMAQKLSSYTSELHKKTHQLQHLAEHDSLSGLPNRMVFIQDLDHFLTRNQKVAVLFLDIDRFKQINDTLGHRVGDCLLQSVALRLKETLEDNGSVYRYAGDEFTIILPKGKMADEVANKILHSFHLPFMLENREFFVTTSIGISHYNSDVKQPDCLIKNADLAMYHAKELGGNRYETYTDSMYNDFTEQMIIENNLRKALQQQEFELYYQPQMNIGTGKIIGMESLIRWNDPTEGQISPLKFIPLAERIGLIDPIGDWVLRTACQQNKQWQEEGYPAVKVAVNLSTRQFQREDLVNTIGEILEETGLQPQYLELEITESISMLDAQEVVSKLYELKSLGVSISIDDFGTGYSSLSYLQKFPIDSLKIDQSFVSQIMLDDDSISIIQNIITLAHNLNISVVAEGVETMDQFSFLKNNDCNDIQGYLLSKPLTKEEFEETIIALLETAVSISQST